MKQNHGFSLLELLLAVSLGLFLLGVGAAALFSEQRLGWRMGLFLRQRRMLLRANQLIAADIERGVALAPELTPVCPLAGRQLWLQLLSPDGALTTYSLGKPPSGIWQGHVLMRCGPAYGLDGQIAAGSHHQNRVVLDQLKVSPGDSCSLPQGQQMPGVPLCWEPSSGLVQWQLQLERDGLVSQRYGQALLMAW